MRYTEPTKMGCLVSTLIWAVIGVVVGVLLGLFLGPVGLIVGAIGGLLLGLAQAGRNLAEKEKQYQETQQYVMQKVQTGVPLTDVEQALWDRMNQNPAK